MKKILITGTNSYIGTSLEQWLKNSPDKYSINAISVRDDTWEKVDFSVYDVVFHVAALVHKKEKADMKALYLKVNRDLPVDIAKKAKVAGVKQFIFISTMAIYGEEGKIGEEVVITSNTKPKPNSYYGSSKLEAEKLLNKLKKDSFKIVILRPPMVYGPNCLGNYAKLEKLAKNIPFFPLIENKRSMLHIDGFCYQVKEIIDLETEGLFFPQDDEYINTSFLVKKIAEQNGKKIFLSRLMGFLIIIIGNKVPLINKIFGNLVYEKNK